MANLWVPDKNLRDTYRGELDSTGKDEAAWRLDRRLEVKLNNP